MPEPPPVTSAVRPFTPGQLFDDMHGDRHGRAHLGGATRECGILTGSLRLEHHDSALVRVLVEKVRCERDAAARPYARRCVSLHVNPFRRAHCSRWSSRKRSSRE